MGEGLVLAVDDVFTLGESSLGFAEVSAGSFEFFVDFFFAGESFALGFDQDFLGGGVGVFFGAFGQLVGLCFDRVEFFRGEGGGEEDSHDGEEDRADDGGDDEGEDGRRALGWIELGRTRRVGLEGESGEDGERALVHERLRAEQARLRGVRRAWVWRSGASGRLFGGRSIRKIVERS